MIRKKMGVGGATPLPTSPTRGEEGSRLAREPKSQLR
jgi:hypothetical protein